MTKEEKLAFNLNENIRKYSDIEKAKILHKLKHAGSSDNKIIEKYMPVLGLEHSKKLLHDFLEVGKFNDNFQNLLHDLKTPLRVLTPMFRWNIDSQGAWHYS